MKEFNLPLFQKFLIAVLAIVISFGGINAYLIWRDVQRALEKESEKSAIIQGKNLAHLLEDPLLYEDYVVAQNVLENAKKTNEDLEYLFILDVNESLVLHTFEGNFPYQLITANKNKSDSISIKLIKNFLKKDKIIRDLAIPIFHGKLGVLRLGVSEERIVQSVSTTVMHFWFMVGFFLFFGILGAFVFATFITKPIKKIQFYTDNLNFEALEERKIPRIEIRKKIFNRFKVLFRAKDEIDLLSEKFNDMIERLEEAYSKLKKTQKHLVESEKLATIGTLAAGIAHEVNNPIGGLKNAIRRIQNDPKNIEKNTTYFALMNTAVDRIEKVVGELLNFSRKEKLNKINLNVKDLIERVELLLQYKIKKNNIIIEKNIPENSFIYGSLQHIEQVVVNLIINSIDAINEADKKDKRININFSEDEKYSRLEIIDNGIGIDEEKLKHVTEPFFTTKLAGKGTGLGLTVTANIINTHSGSIKILSEVDKGTKVIINLPKRKNGK